MSEETFALVGLIFGATLLCGAGALALFLPMVDSIIERRRRKRAAGGVGESERSPADAGGDFTVAAHRTAANHRNT